MFEDETGYITDVLNMSDGSTRTLVHRPDFSLYRELYVYGPGHTYSAFNGITSQEFLYVVEHPFLPAYENTRFSNGFIEEFFYYPGTPETQTRVVTYPLGQYQYSEFRAEYGQDGARDSERFVFTDGRVELKLYDTSGSSILSHTITETAGNGVITVDTLENSVVVSRTITDPQDAENFTSITETFANGQITERHAIKDDGSSVAVTFENGVRSQAVIDLDGEAGNVGTIRTFDETGARTGETITYANGLIETKTWTDGNLATRSLNDSADTFDFASLEWSFNADNNTSTRVVTGDTGTIMTTNYEDSSLVSRQVADAADLFDFHERSWTYDDMSHVLTQTTVMDNGLIREDTFIHGDLATRTQRDGGDDYAWSERTLTYENGVVVSTETILDEI